MDELEFGGTNKSSLFSDPSEPVAPQFSLQLNADELLSGPAIVSREEVATQS
jgi:hypothetical protein